MDLLSNKVHKTGDQVYFLIASLEEPFIYIRVAGTIQNVVDFGDRIYYHITHHRFLETNDFLFNHVQNYKFRMKSPKGDYLDKKFLIRDQKKTPDEMFFKTMKNWEYDVRSIMAFDTMTELDTEMQNINIELRDYIHANLKILESRIFKNKP